MNLARLLDPAGITQVWVPWVGLTPTSHLSTARKKKKMVADPSFSRSLRDCSMLLTQKQSSAHPLDWLAVSQITLLFTSMLASVILKIWALLVSL